MTPERIEEADRASEGVRATSRLSDWLARPITRPWRIASWALVGALFFGVASWAIGGVGSWSGVPNYGDASFSYYTIWAVAHGNLACAYPPQHFHGLPVPDKPYSYIAPLYPLIAGGISALVGLGGSVAFPSAHAMGPQCSHALLAMHSWASAANVTSSTVSLGLLMWFVLLVGYLSIVTLAERPIGRWEVVGLLAVSLCAPILDAEAHYFHPEDILGLGLVMLGTRLLIRSRWWAAGVVLGLALVAHQLGVVAIIIALMLVPWSAKWRIAVGSGVAAIAVLSPFLLLQSGGTGSSIFAGSSIPHGTRATLVGELHLALHTSSLIARGGPLVLTLVLAWWVRKRMPLSALEIASLVFVAMGTRLIFEVNLFGYYFLPMAVGLVVIEVMQGRLRSVVVAWLMLQALAYSQFDIGSYALGNLWATFLDVWIPILLIGSGVIALLLSLRRRRVAWHWVVFLVVGGVAMALNARSGVAVTMAWPLWVWQLILVPSGLALLGEPLWRSVARGASAIGLVQSAESSSVS